MSATLPCPDTATPGPLPLAALAALSAELAQARSRPELTRRIAQFLRAAPPPDRPLAVRLLVGRPFPEGDPRRLNVRASTFWRVASHLLGSEEAAPRSRGAVADWVQAVDARLTAIGWSPNPPPLTVRDAIRAFEALAAQRGRGARQKQEELLGLLLRRASPAEAGLLARCILGEMRHGAIEANVLEAIAEATGASPESVRRAAILLGDIGEVAERGFAGGPPALRAATLRLFRPLKPMLAQTAQSLADAWSHLPNGFGMEFKLDGARIQIHVERDEVRLFSRRLHDVTDNLPGIVAEVRGSLALRRAILEGEVIGMDADGRPLPFQTLRGRYRPGRAVGGRQGEGPLRLFVFDLLLEEEECLIERPYRERWHRLLETHGGLATVPRCTPRALAEAEAFWREALEAGYKGVMLKRLDSPYTPGLRGTGWLTLKRTRSLDLVIVAAEYGDGRRRDWLSSYRVAARDEESGEFRPVGKTFKGLTDDEIRRMTARLLALKRMEEGGIVLVEPEVVVEVQYADIQPSPVYPDGMALRSARITGVRDDKLPMESDTVQHIRGLFTRQPWETAG